MRRRPIRQMLAVACALTLVLAACGGADGADDEELAAAVEEDYPDAITREIRRRAAEPRPVSNSALPPRHLDAEAFPESLVERTRIVSGGPPADAIPSIDDPTFERAEDVDWIEDNEPVLALTIDDETRAYPLQIMTWHEIVNDVVAGEPVVVTYCPLCNSGVAFRRTAEGEVLDFGTSGGLFQSALVMYDRQTESLWTHFDGRAVIGDLVGEELDVVPTAIIGWADFREAHPDAAVLGPESPPQPYGRNPYGFYDQRERPLAGFFTGDVDDRLEPMQRVIGLRAGEDQVAVDLAGLAAAGVVEVNVGGRRAVVWHHAGTASALDGPTIAGGADVGATGAFYTKRLFESSGAGFVDADTGSAWNVLGEAVDGELAGEALEPVEHIDTFWFAWSTYHPDTELAG